MTYARERRADALIVLVLLALPLLVFWRLAAPDPADRRIFAHGDFDEQYYPLRRFAMGELMHGRLPLWNPHIYAGQPALADIQSGALYPVSWLTALLAGPRPLPFLALEAEAVFHFGLAGIFTYFLARRLMRHRGAALVAALTFALGGYLLSYPGEQLTILETDVWLPAILLCLDRGLGGRFDQTSPPAGMSRRFIVLGGVALAMAILAGHPQSLLYVGYASALYLVFRAYTLELGWRQTGLALAIWAGIGVGLSAVQWLPTLEFARLSSRASISYADISSGLPAGDVLQVLWPGRRSWHSPLYVGLLPLGLAGLALWARRGRETAFWGGLALAALLLSFGDEGVLFRLFHLVVPGFRLFRSQERAAFLFSFAMAMLAGYGMTVVAGRLERRHSGRQHLGLAITLAAAAIVVVDLYQANVGRTLRPVPAGGLMPVTEASVAIGSDQARPFRVSSEGLLPLDGNAGIIYGFQDVTGNSPLHLRRYEQFLADVPELRWWQLLGVRYVLTRRELTHGAVWLVLRDSEGRNLYQFGQALPRAWVVHEIAIAPDEATARRLVSAGDFDPARSVVLLERPAVALPASPVAGSVARIISYAPTRIEIEADLAAGGLLVLSEAHYPGWRATANGDPVPILLANGFLRAIPLAQGSWHVEIVYAPWTFRAGLGLSLLTALAAAVGFQISDFRFGI